jgi:molybdate/tungstate transport system permease protein
MPRPRSPAAPAAPRPVLAAALAAALLGFLALPVLVLVASGLAADGAAARLARDAELWQALATTFAAATAAVGLAVVTGTPLAWLLARGPFRGRALVEALLDLPLVLPHPVAGLALLLVLGRASPAGAALAAAGLRVVGTPLGTVAAMLFVAAPLYVSAARAALAAVDPAHELTARTLGAPRWRAVARVTLPMASRGLLAGAVVAWARALSEFGAIVVLAYHPRVASTLVYERLTGYGLAEALPAAAALVLVALVPLVALRALRPTGG